MHFLRQSLGRGKGMSTMDDNHEIELLAESEELPPLGPGQLRISSEIAGKRVRSLYIRYTENYNIVEVDFVDGTSLSVELFPMVKLKAELNDWNVESGRVLKRWPRMIAR
jgi:hypothetical protein